MMLPARVPEDAWETRWKSQLMSNTPSSSLWINITLFGFPSIKNGQQFSAAFKQVIKTLTDVVVHINQVWEVLGPLAVPEATIVNFHCFGQPASRLLDLVQTTDFITLLLEELGENGSDMIRVEVSSTVNHDTNNFLSTTPSTSDANTMP